MWDLGIKDIIDILIVAWILFYLYRSSSKNDTLVLFQGVLAVFLIWVVVSQVLQMKLLGAIMDSLISVGLIVLAILLQNDIRRFLVRLGSRRRWKSLMNIFGAKTTGQDDHLWIDALVLACRNMSQNKVGALICIEKTDSLQSYADTGEIIDAKLTTRLIEQIFYKNTPLHDGAAIVRDGRVNAAACILPVSHNARIPKELGLRHRSGLGLTELTDAVVVIVSEETGGISLASHGRFHRDLSINMLQKLLLKS
ncbi:MAG: diadenylate cyclase CdaA [Bacteroidales bacterium]|nr:diadenylate cyclase CdaA [Bacteroidales bacterium]